MELERSVRNLITIVNKLFELLSSLQDYFCSTREYLNTGFVSMQTAYQTRVADQRPTAVDRSHRTAHLSEVIRIRQTVNSRDSGDSDREACDSS